MNGWGFGFSFLISTHSMLSLFLDNTTTKELVMNTKVTQIQNKYLWYRFQHLTIKQKTITIHANGLL